MIPQSSADVNVVMTQKHIQGTFGWNQRKWKLVKSPNPLPASPPLKKPGKVTF